MVHNRAAAASCDPTTLMADPLSILSVGVAYWGSDDGSQRTACRADASAATRVESITIRSSRSGCARCTRLSKDGRTARRGPVPDRPCPDRRSRGCRPRRARLVRQERLHHRARARLLGHAGECCSISTWSPTSRWPRTADGVESASIAVRRERSLPRTRSTRHRASRFRRSSSAERSRASCDRTSATGSSAATSARRSVPTRAPPRTARSRLLARVNAYPSLPRLLDMSSQTFRELYRGTAVMRARRAGLARNAAVALGNIGTEDDVPPLAQAALGHDLALVRGHAAGRWRGSAARGPARAGAGLGARA